MTQTGVRTMQVVETADLYLEQFPNGSIYVYNKETGKMIMHASCSGMYSTKGLLAFANRIRVPGKKKEAGDRNDRCART